jgi:hypothetical protein
MSGTRLFSIDPAYQCVGGPFFWGSKDSETYKFCSNPANWPAISQVECCGAGMVGKPYTFRYSTESDGNWKNTRCDCLNNEVLRVEPGLTYTKRLDCISNKTNLCYETRDVNPASSSYVNFQYSNNYCPSNNFGVA